MSLQSLFEDKAWLVVALSLLEVGSTVNQTCVVCFRNFKTSSCWTDGRSYRDDDAAVSRAARAQWKPFVSPDVPAIRRDGEWLWLRGELGGVRVVRGCESLRVNVGWVRRWTLLAARECTTAVRRPRGPPARRPRPPARPPRTLRRRRPRPRPWSSRRRAAAPPKDSGAALTH